MVNFEAIVKNNLRTLNTLMLQMWIFSSLETGITFFHGITHKLPGQVLDIDTISVLHDHEGKGERNLVF